VYVPSISYFYILVVITCVSFFTLGARMDGRSPIVWGALSFGAWLCTTQWLMPSLMGGILSQVILFVCLGVWGVIRDRRSKKPSDLGR
jgi:hypothetical protein